MPNLFSSQEPVDFWVWLTPDNWLFNHQITVTGGFTSGGLIPTSAEISRRSSTESCEITWLNSSAERPCSGSIPVREKLGAVLKNQISKLLACLLLPQSAELTSQHMQPATFGGRPLQRRAGQPEQPSFKLMPPHSSNSTIDLSTMSNVMNDHLSG